MAFASLLNDRFPRQAETWLVRRPTHAAASYHTRAYEPVTSNDLSVHCGPVLIALGCCAWFAVLSWACFAQFDREAGLAVGVVTLISMMYLGGIALGAVHSVSSRAGGHGRSFRQFLRGRVDIATGIISGREAMVQIAMLPVSLAVGATAMGLIWVAIN